MTSPATSKKIHLIRHAEAEHNVAWKIHGDVIWDDPYYTNPTLTDDGIKQAHELKRYQELYEVDKIFVSPSQRTLETATILYDIGPLHGDDRLLEYGPGRIVNRRDPRHLLADEWPMLDLTNVTHTVPNEKEESADIFDGRLKSIIDQVLNDDNLISVAFVTHHDVIHRIWHLYMSHQACPAIKNGQYLTLEM
jgi:broad specificity phosphatase PhoE